jgi:uncharacterized hydrophobic protein (TIGR00271 family)
VQELVTAPIIDEGLDPMSDAIAAPRTGLLQRILPLNQRKTPDELSDAIDLAYGDTSAKQSAFWTMLVLSGVIAAAGVVGNSTATVIGAMIIAPLGTPIMGMALGVVLSRGKVLRSSAAFVFSGMLVVITIGLVFSLGLPDSTNLLANPQITARTSPNLVDMIAAVATGFAGAVGLARRDVSDVLPGVAIAISLVPPLAVVGICLGQSSFALAIGALLLFASNVLAMVLAGTLMFAVAFAAERQGGKPRRSYLAIATLLVLILIPLGANTASALFVSIMSSRIDTAAQSWLADSPGAQVLEVDFTSNTAVIKVLAPGSLPPTSTLLDSLQGKVPKGVEIVVDVAQGSRQTAGTVS